MRALRDARQHREHIEVHLARIGLPRDGVAGGKAHLGSNLLFQFLDLFVVALEQLEEAGTGARRALAAAQFQLRQLEIELCKVHEQVVEPKRGTLADRGGLRRLEMCIGERRLVLIARGKAAERQNGV